MLTVLTAADYADTGQWRLIVRIHPTGISAHLENTLHDDVDPQPLFESEWEEDPANLLNQIENAVYDHPRVLDDFSARIIIFDRHTLFVPSSVVDETEGAEETLYTTVYDAEPDDIMTDRDKDLTALFAPVSGLKAFLCRTFPGARVSCNLMRAVAEKRGNNTGITLFIRKRKHECDFILLKNSDLLSASTRTCGEEGDIAYHAFNLFDIYGIDPKDGAVVCEGFQPSDSLRTAIDRFTRNTTNQI